MPDDMDALSLTRERIDVVIAEIKEGQCHLNGPWTDPFRENVQRVLAAIGCVPHCRISDVAAALYDQGFFDDGVLLRVRLVAFGRAREREISANYPQVCQITLEAALRFIYRRFQRYWRQKRDTQHWNASGRLLKQQAAKHHGREDDFIAWAVGTRPSASGQDG